MEARDPLLTGLAKTENADCLICILDFQMAAFLIHDAGWMRVSLQ
jgi:hypothetical protein